MVGAVAGIGIARQRIALCIAFDGAKFHGWQKQSNAFTVQEALEQALTKLEGSQSAPDLVAAGRTDTGVHATHMLTHADVLRARWQDAPQAYVKGLNYHLRDVGVQVLGAREVAQDFHARFDCVERRYQYKIWNRTVRSVHLDKLAWWVPQPLDTDAMNQAALPLLGEHDFSSFRAAGCQSHSCHRQLKRLEVSRLAHVLTIDVVADAFLYHMVRNLVGSLVEVGKGKWQPEMMAHILAQKDRTQAAATAPAHGLYFDDAVYPDFTAKTVAW